MTQTQLINFIKGNSIKVQANLEGHVMWVPGPLLDAFTLMAYAYFHENAVLATVTSGAWVGLEFEPICEYFKIDTQYVINKLNT